MTSIQTAELDPSFGQNGKVEIRTPGNFFNVMTSVTTDASGRLLIYGSYAQKGNAIPGLGVARLREDGQFDHSFGDQQDGLAVVPHRVQASMGSALVCMNDGAIFTTGPAAEQLPLLHYDEDGRHIADRDLGGGQMKSMPQLLNAANDKLWVAVSSSSSGVLLRRNTDGTPDTNFGEEGKTTFLTGGRYQSVVHMSGSRTGSSFYIAGELENDGFILRMKDDGELDTSFAEAGVYRIAITGSGFGSCRKAIELGNGKILALVNSAGSACGSIFLIRLTPLGQPDPGFNNGQPLAVPGEVADSMTVQADGKILVTHRGVLTGQQLSRYRPDGVPDISFGDNGTITFTDQQFTLLKSVIIQPDGKLVVAGQWGSITTLLRLMR
jgi:uncharacterized delta-60 repeat protein